MNLTWGILSKYKNELYGFSIIWIILFHGLELRRASLGKALDIFKGVIKHGNCGVEVFLFLSGLCLYYSMKKNPDITTFYISRLKRIFIPLLLIDGVYWLYSCVIQKGDFVAFLKNITFYSFWVGQSKQVWFIALIMVLYAIYPFLYKYILNNEKVDKFRIVVILCIFVYVACYGLRVFNPAWYKSVEIALTRIPVFLLGSYCGILSYEDRVVSTKVKACSLIIMLAGIGFFYVHPVSLVKYFRTPYLLVGPSIALWICVCLEIIKSEKINRFLCNWGMLSLELYLTHVTFRIIYRYSFLYGKGATANFYKYVLVVMILSYVVSKLVSVLTKKIDASILLVKRTD